VNRVFPVCLVGLLPDFATTRRSGYSFFRVTTNSTFIAVRSHAARLRQAGQRPRVLVVDDEPLILELVARVLRDAGYDVDMAGDGLEGLDAADVGGPLSLLLVDLKMPHMSGEELANRLRKTDPQLKVLYMTAFTAALFANRVTLADGEAFLGKPFSTTGLLEAVSQLLYDQLLPEAPEKAVLVPRLSSSQSLARSR
jgi:CheY-like chemotaxis protein